jgi:hypothetical protein
MGRLRRSRVHNARRDVHRASRTRVSDIKLCHFPTYPFELGENERFGPDPAYRFRSESEALPVLDLRNINGRYDSRIGQHWKLSRLILTSQAWRNTTAWNVQSTFSAALSICDADMVHF